MKKEEVQEIFLKILREEEDVSAGVAAIRTLLSVIENYKVATVRELDLNLQLAVDAMKHCDQPVTAISSGCELFMRFITFAKLDTNSFEECEQIMLQRGHIFLNTLLEARSKVVKESMPFITDGCRDLPNEFKYLSSVLKSGKDLTTQHPLVDYTPPLYITLLFTDIGMLTPSAVSDELIKLYL
ncbi:hypothetical protein B5X24_HaOG203919 [Helicoverpa armigera]|uniref:Translation initiation factor eIF2B subunit alpha n=1 Tax=Helicoverpa armigera TaxID=29058 RepID=A0A2W1BPJ1_HELAM|nr:hypothetical protein B5X24_HaOG203919 [Helicoverpa armigera]